jgi:tetratricopeptide (TPR) repeat protein
VAEEHLERLVLSKEDLDQMGADQWAGDTYDEIMQLSREGDAHFLRNEYIAASNAYQEAASRAQELLNSSGRVLERMLTEGAAALSENNAQLAGERFSMALRIDPANESAQRGLRRSETIEKVKSLLRSGSQHEEEANAAFALADYQEALRMDPSSAEASRALERVKNRIADEQFQQVMSNGLSALHRGDYKEARESLRKAKSFRPDSPEVIDAAAQVDQAIHLERIAELKRRAEASEEAEAWEQALEYYQSVLKLDPAIQFAARGKERCLERIHIDHRMRFYLDNPELLESDGHLRDAVTVLNQASNLRPKGPGLRSGIAQLDDLIGQAKMPVKVILLSDNLTDVSVYRVGRFGKFQNLTLNLRPGTYTAVGSRIGYKDVRRQIVVTAGMEPLRITVQCEEKI